MTRTITLGDDIIDSRDIIERIEELKDEIKAHKDKNEEDLKDKNDELRDWEIVVDKFDIRAGWVYGETLILRSYFQDYIEELIRDCYPDLFDFKANQNDWPYRHVTVDFEAAAKEAEVDYMSETVGGFEYLVHTTLR